MRKKEKISFEMEDYFLKLLNLSKNFYYQETSTFDTSCILSHPYTFLVIDNKSENMNVGIIAQEDNKIRLNIDLNDGFKCTHSRDTSLNSSSSECFQIKSDNNDSLIAINLSSSSEEVTENNDGKGNAYLESVKINTTIDSYPIIFTLNDADKQIAFMLIYDDCVGAKEEVVSLNYGEIPSLIYSVYVLGNAESTTLVPVKNLIIRTEDGINNAIINDEEVKKIIHFFNKMSKSFLPSYPNFISNIVSTIDNPLLNKMFQLGEPEGVIDKNPQSETQEKNGRILLPSWLQTFFGRKKKGTDSEK